MRTGHEVVVVVHSRVAAHPRREVHSLGARRPNADLEFSEGVSSVSLGQSMLSVYCCTSIQV